MVLPHGTQLRAWPDYGGAAGYLGRVMTSFIKLYFLYRKHHGRKYSAQRAWSIAVTGLPF